MQRSKVGLAGAALDDVLIRTRMADLLFGGGDAAVNLVGRIGATARETATEFGVVADADEDRDERSGEKRVGGTLRADGGGTLDVDVQERVEARA